MPNDLQRLHDTVFKLHPLEDMVWDEFTSIWQTVTYKRKTTLTVAGEVERNLYFVLDGVQRAFYVSDNHPESTIVFTYAGSFSGVADSFLTQLPSRYFLETLTASRMMKTSYLQVKQLMDKHHSFERWMRLAISFTLMGVLERQTELQTFSAEEKFRTLLTRSPHVLQLIPHKYLASYLGIDASTFSKLMGSIRL